MKILLINSTPVSSAFEALKLPGGYNGSGWVEEILPRLKESHEVIFACFWTVNELKSVKKDGICYYVIPAASPDLRKIDDRIRQCLKDIYEKNRPEVIHAFGTENNWTREVLKIMDAGKVVIHITGLAGFCAQHFYGGLEAKEVRRTTLRDWLKGGIRHGRKQFEKCGRAEQDSLLMAKQVMGRTTWDRACVTLMNKDITYFHCNEMLRKQFYENKWSLERCKRRRVFISAGNMPLKGAHQAVKAMAVVKERYPDAELVIAGNNVIKNETFRDRLAMTSYGKYIRKLIKKYGLEKNVRYAGPQTAPEMVRQYLEANVYVLPSAIENSPNSLGEAMLLGLPCVAACVGGVQDLLKDKEEGYIYPFDEPYMLAYYIMQIFENDSEAGRLGENARERAMQTHDRDSILRQLSYIYQKIADGEKG